MRDHKSYSELVIQPVIAILSSPVGGKEHLAGPIYPDFENQGYSRHLRGSGQPIDECPPMPEVSSIEPLDEEFLYGGCLIDHFGHFIAEFIHRILTSIQVYPGLRVIFVGAPGVSQASLPSFISHIFTYLGISDRVLIVDKPVRVRRLYVFPQEEYLGGPPPQLSYLHALHTVQKQKLTPLRSVGDVLFVSRSKQQRGGFAGEFVLDALFASLGATVFYPEEHSLTDQLNTYISYRRIIFSEGSALHGLQLLGQLEAEVTVLCRRHGQFGSNFLRPRVRKLDYVSLIGGEVYGYTYDGSPATWTSIVFLNQWQLEHFCKSYFTEAGSTVIGTALDSAAERLRMTEHDALCNHLQANSRNPLWSNRTAIFRQITLLKRFSFREMMTCMVALNGSDLIPGQAFPGNSEQTLDMQEIRYSDNAGSWLAMLAELEEKGLVDTAYMTEVNTNPDLPWYCSNPAALQLMYALARPGAGRLVAYFRNSDPILRTIDWAANSGLFLRVVLMRAALPEQFSYRVDAPALSLALLAFLRKAEAPLWQKLALCLFVVLPGIDLNQRAFAFLCRQLRWLHGCAERGYIAEEFFRHSPVFDLDDFQRRAVGLGSAFWEWDGNEGFVQELWLLYHISPYDDSVTLTLSRVFQKREEQLEALFFALMAVLKADKLELIAHLARCLMVFEAHLDTSLIMWRYVNQLNPTNIHYNNFMQQTMEMLLPSR
jgi:hypothetical protein